MPDLNEERTTIEYPERNKALAQGGAVAYRRCDDSRLGRHLPLLNAYEGRRDWGRGIPGASSIGMAHTADEFYGCLQVRLRGRHDSILEVSLRTSQCRTLS
jgi:hypothetical protein